MKLSGGLELFLTAIKSDGLSAETIAWYKKRLSRLILFLGDPVVVRVKVDDLRRFVVSLQDQSVLYQSHKYHVPVAGFLSPSTVQGYIRCVKRLFSWFEDESLVKISPAYRLKKNKLPKSQPREIDERDLLALLRVSKTWGRHCKRNYALLMFLADTGVRVGGLVGLRVSALDLKKRQATVIEKGSKARVVFFGAKTALALKTWFLCRGLPGDSVFGLTADGVRVTLRHLKLAAGVKGRVNPHSFRHAFAKRTIVNGGDVAVLSALMGHSDIKVTRDSYLIFRTAELQKQYGKYSGLDRKK